MTDGLSNAGLTDIKIPMKILNVGTVVRLAALLVFLTMLPGCDGSELQEPVSNEFYYIVSGKCTECTGFHEEPQCAAVCPVDCCVPDPDMVESKEELMAKKAWLHQEVEENL